MVESKKHKVAFIHPDLGIGGAERLVLDIAVALAEQGNEVLFITNHFDKAHAFEELRDGRFPVRVVGDWMPRSFCGMCQALCAYLRMIYLALVYVLFIRKEDNPDVFFIDQIPMAVPFIKCAGGKVIYYCHHPDLLASPPGGRLKKLYRLPIDWLELRGTALADVILVNSKYTASIFRKTFPQITKDIHILYPTISASYQTTVSSNRTVKTINQLVPEIQARKDNIIFLSINRYHPAKKLELALNGFEALKSKLSPNDWSRVYLVMAGGYDPQSTVNAKYFSKLVELSQAKNLTTKVIFLKSPSDSLKADLLLVCDCLIYTPTNEHFGIVPLEAMTAGKPVIACNSGGPCETVQHQVTGYLCEPTPDSLAEAMSKMLNKSHACKMGLLGKGRLQKYFSHDTFTSSVNDVVTSLVSGNSAKIDETGDSLWQIEEKKINDNSSIIPEIEQESEEEEIKNDSKKVDQESLPDEKCDNLKISEVKLAESNDIEEVSLPNEKRDNLENGEGKPVDSNKVEEVTLPDEEHDNLKKNEGKPVASYNAEEVSLLNEIRDNLKNSKGKLVNDENDSKQTTKSFLSAETESYTSVSSPASSCYMSPLNVSSENLNTSDSSDTVN